MSNGTQKLGRLLRSQMHEVSKFNIGGGSFMFGKITSDKGLKLDGIDYTIPRRDYLVCRHCTEDFAAGRRVAVGIYNNEPVVIGII